MTTKQIITKHLFEISHLIENVHIDTYPSIAKITIKLKWYAWLLFGLLHYSIRQEAIKLLDEIMPAWVIFEVIVK